MEGLKKKKGAKIHKVAKKFNKLRKAGKLKRHTLDALKEIKAKRQGKSRKRALDIEDDWVEDRSIVKENEEDEDILPLDMLDADLDWENSAFANVKRRLQSKVDGVESKKRRFATDLDEDREELLPIKLSDGRLVRPTREKVPEDNEEDEGSSQVSESKEEDLSALSTAEVVMLRKQKLQESQGAIAAASLALLADSQENIFKLRDLYNMCCGNNVHSLVRESIQLRALASLLEVFIDIIPGYAIRELTDDEKSQKQKKETKKLRTFEESLLRYYLKYLQFLEKNCLKLWKNATIEEASFTYRLSMACVRALARLLVRVSHFNYTANIISILARMSLSPHLEAADICCAAISQLFKEDFVYKLSLHGAKTIASLVVKRKGNVSPSIVATFLHLNIKEVKNEDEKSKKGSLIAKKYMIKKERTSKSKKKYAKQLKKLEADLKEAEATESMSVKMRNATETMKYVFMTYFRVLKRMPSTAVLRPVLEGLSKFAHLLNIEFFDDLVRTMEDLMENKQLNILDRIHCVSTVFTILSGEGKALNVDPRAFYRTIYSLLPVIGFERNNELLRREVAVLIRTLQMMLCERKKQVPLERVAAFAKRLAGVCVIMPDDCAVALLAFLRCVFISHPRLEPLVDAENDGDASTGPFRADIDDPDIVAASKSSIRPELIRLFKRQDLVLKTFSDNLLHGVPSSGTKRLSANLATRKPSDFLFLNDSTTTRPDLDELQKFAKKKGVVLSSKNVSALLLQWLE